MDSQKKEFKKLYELLGQEKAAQADAIIWLQGDRYDRAHKTLKLYNDGWAKKIIISGNNILIGNKKRKGENNISLDSMQQFLFRQGVVAKNLIIDGGAMNTKEQAMRILKLAKANKWSKLILIGSSYYQPRAFLTFLKQAKKIGWQGRIINQTKIVAWDKKPAGRDKTAAFLFNEEFKKIEEYKKDLVSIKQGIEYLSKRSLSLRKVSGNDIELLFKWVNDPVVRANTRNPKSVTWWEHSAWFKEKLAAPNTYMYILTEQKHNIGIIRFDKKDKKFIISYSIDKTYRGQGLGKLILIEGLRKLSLTVHQPHFIAQVKQGNIASEKIFNTLGFRLTGKEFINNIKFNIYQK